jgi:spore maturation protein CgeB
MQNNTALKDKVALLEINLTTLQNRQCDLDIRNQPIHLEKALQITDNKLNEVINDANVRKQDFMTCVSVILALQKTCVSVILVLQRHVSL